MKRFFTSLILSGIFVALASFSALASVSIGTSSIPGPITISDSTNPFYISNFEFDPDLDIAYFELNLNYSGVNNGNMKWYVTPFSGSDVDTSKFDDSYPYILSASGEEQPFTFTSNFLGSYFKTFKEKGYFSLGFYENTGKDDSFKLDSATLTIYGTPAAVPIPGAMLLFGTGLLGLLGLRQRQIR